MSLNREALDRLIMEVLSEKDLKGYQDDFDVSTSDIAKNRTLSKIKDVEWLVGSSRKPYKEIVHIFNTYLSTGGLGDSLKKIAAQFAGGATEILNDDDFLTMIQDKDNPYNRRALEWVNSMARYTTKTTRSASDLNSQLR